MSSNDVIPFAELGMARTFPKVLASRFAEHAALFGFAFDPTIAVKGGEQWLVLNVRPTKEADCEGKLHVALLQAVKHVLLAPRHDDGGIYNADKVQAQTGISGAIQAKLSEAHTHASQTSNPNPNLNPYLNSLRGGLSPQEHPGRPCGSNPGGHLLG